MHSMGAHPNATQVRASGCLALESLATFVDNLVKIAPLGGIEVALRAMKAHLEATQIQVSGCAALWNLVVDEGNQVKIASPFEASRR